MATLRDVRGGPSHPGPKSNRRSQAEDAVKTGEGRDEVFSRGLADGVKAILGLRSTGAGGRYLRTEPKTSVDATRA